jgi:hypothetical protein
VRPDDLLRFIRRRPFEPFRIHIADGTVYDIRGPEMAFVQRSTVDVAVPLANQSDALMEVTVALLHITRIEPIVRS